MYDISLVCKYKFLLKYINGLKTLQINESDNALVLGKTIHLALETNLEEAEKYYFSQFNIIDDKQINEFLKIELLYPKIKRRRFSPLLQRRKAEK